MDKIKNNKYQEDITQYSTATCGRVASFGLKGQGEEAARTKA